MALTKAVAWITWRSIIPPIRIARRTCGAIRPMRRIWVSVAIPASRWRTQVKSAIPDAERSMVAWIASIMPSGAANSR